MSAKIMGLVWDLDLPHHKQSILLAMADHADHNGRNIYPSLGFIAWKTGYSIRQVRRIVRELQTDGLLILEDVRRGSSQRYRIDLSTGKPKPPYQPKSDTPDKMSDPPGHSYVLPTPDIAMSAEPSYKPSVNPPPTPPGVFLGGQNLLPGMPPEPPPESAPKKPKPRKPIWDAVTECITHSSASGEPNGLTKVIVYGNPKQHIVGFVGHYFGEGAHPDIAEQVNVASRIRGAIQWKQTTEGLAPPRTGEKLCALVREYEESEHYRDLQEMKEHERDS